TWFVCRRLRFRLVAFLVRMWLRLAWPALYLPEAVLRKRLAAARLVLILGITNVLDGNCHWQGGGPCAWRESRQRAEPTLSILARTGHKPLIPGESTTGPVAVASRSGERTGRRALCPRGLFFANQRVRPEGGRGAAAKPPRNRPGRRAGRQTAQGARVA